MVLGLHAAQARVIEAVRTRGSVADATVSRLLPDLPPDAAVKIDRSSITGDIELASDVSLVDIDEADGPVLRFLEPTEEGKLRLQLLMTFPDVEPLPLGEMVVEYDAATGQPTRALGLAY